MQENYLHENTSIYGGLLPFKFDYMEVTSFDANDNPLVVDFYQNYGYANQELVTRLTMTYNGNGVRQSIQAEHFIQYIDRTPNIR